jgi:endonuclease III
MTPTEKAWRVHEILNTFYGPVALGNPRRGPLHELVSTMLSHRTTHRDEETAYQRMFEAFGDWEGIMTAPTAALAHAVRTTRWPDTQAPRIQEVLRRIKAERGEFTVDFLAEMSTEDAMQWLTALPGIGLKTASLLLLFNFQKPVIPVDTHVHRVAQRVGIIGPKTTHDQAHAILLDMLGPAPTVLYNYHVHNLWHGQRICFFTSPNCPACPLNSFCDYGQKRLGNAAPPQS